MHHQCCTCLSVRLSTAADRELCVCFSFEERCQALETLISNHRESSTFEELVGSVYSQAPPVSGPPTPRPAQGQSGTRSRLSSCQQDAFWAINERERINVLKGM